ncbi:MAG TPA: hypothetical protein VHX88_20415 [Solirubrobacteraceae bacterium]|nr:hypothetical protein [Solirubrobacteraceae bacterium]
MPGLVGSVLAALRREERGHCAVCRRPVARQDVHTTLRAGAPVHRECAVYRARSAKGPSR